MKKTLKNILGGGGATFVQYGDEYYLWEPNCTLMNSNGAAMQMTEEEYDSIIGELDAWEQ